MDSPSNKLGYLDKANESRTVSTNITRRPAMFFGHVTIREPLENIVMTARQAVEKV